MACLAAPGLSPVDHAMQARRCRQSPGLKAFADVRACNSEAPSHMAWEKARTSMPWPAATSSEALGDSSVASSGSAYSPSVNHPFRPCNFSAKPSVVDRNTSLVPYEMNAFSNHKGEKSIPGQCRHTFINQIERVKDDGRQAQASTLRRALPPSCLGVHAALSSIS